MKKESTSWDPGHYDTNFAFVSRLGQNTFDRLRPTKGERILDLGCGTGDLTARIAAEGAETVGYDSSPDMIAEARRKYPHLAFEVADGHTFHGRGDFDAVFSNAALHWMTRPKAAARNIADALRPGGRFVAEFGGKGNIGRLVQAILQVFPDAHERVPWYFPSIGEYAQVLERVGFRVMTAEHFDRPTPLEGGDRAIAGWMKAFGGAFIGSLPEEEAERAVAAMERLLKPHLFDAESGQWIADYKRIRIVAVKEI